ncbi:MAG: peptide chain release factor-like protein [Candidatus Dormibacteria bacterium]
MDAEVVTRHLLQRAQWAASRSSGPGGQRRDKVSTRAELSLGADAVEGLPVVIQARLLRGLNLEERELRISIQDERMLSRNQQLAEQRLRELVEVAIQPPPRPRRPTRPTRAAQAARVDEKTRRGAVKRLRQGPPPADG